MEIIGITRLDADGNPTDQFVVRCEIHNWYFKGMPPITTGCRECWQAYYFAQVARAGMDKKECVDQLESAIRHTTELVEKGGWDFEPLEHPEIKIEEEN